MNGHSSLYIGSLFNDVGSDRVSVLPQRLRDAAPMVEPKPRDGAWVYRVAEPFYTGEAKSNVMQALEDGQISSAASWTQELAARLREFYDVPVAFPTCNGAASLIVALLCSNVGDGDHVIIPSLTMVAVANAVKMVGAIPVYADCASGSLNPSYEEIISRATPKTKAVVVCHTYGVPLPDIKRISEECRTRNWFLIEDICEAIGCRTAEGALVGTFGDFACASMYANKLITSGDGGFVLAVDQKHHDRLKSLINHGFDPRYHFLHFETAPNAKINGIGAALACASVKRIPELIRHRHSLAGWYRQGLADLGKGLTCMEAGPHDTPWVFGVQCVDRKTRDNLREWCATFNIETRNYFFPLHLEPANYFEGTGTYEVLLPNCEQLGAFGFYLPTHPYLTKEDADYICSVISTFFDRSVKTLTCPRQPGWVNGARKTSWNEEARGQKRARG